MTTQEQEIDETVGDDGLTDRERAFIQTPVSQMRPQDVQYGLAMIDKRAEHNYKENEIRRRELEEIKQAGLEKARAERAEQDRLEEEAKKNAA